MPPALPHCPESAESPLPPQRRERWPAQLVLCALMSLGILALAGHLVP